MAKRPVNISKSVACNKTECHGNWLGYCTILTESITSKPCPFYKTKLRLITERQALKEGDYEAYRKASRIR